jgi:hypothetical protein
MTRDEFIKELDKKSYSYEIEGDKIVVTHKVNVLLSSLTSLPPGVEFNNRGSVSLNSLKSLPPVVEFNNKGNVNLESIIGCWFYDWKGNIEGIDSKNLLNVMISKRIFER